MQSTNPRNLREVLKAVKETLDKDGAPLVIINELTSTQGFLRQIRALGDAHNAQFENIIPHNFGKEDNDELIGVARMLKSANLTDLIFYEASNSQVRKMIADRGNGALWYRAHGPMEIIFLQDTAQEKVAVVLLTNQQFITLSLATDEEQRKIVGSVKAKVLRAIGTQDLNDLTDTQLEALKSQIMFPRQGGMARDDEGANQNVSAYIDEKLRPTVGIGVLATAGVMNDAAKRTKLEQSLLQQANQAALAEQSAASASGYQAVDATKETHYLVTAFGGPKQEEESIAHEILIEILEQNGRKVIEPGVGCKGLEMESVMNIKCVGTALMNRIFKTLDNVTDIQATENVCTSLKQLRITKTMGDFSIGSLTKAGAMIHGLVKQLFQNYAARLSIEQVTSIISSMVSNVSQYNSNLQRKYLRENLSKITEETFMIEASKNDGQGTEKTMYGPISMVVSVFEELAAQLEHERAMQAVHAQAGFQGRTGNDKKRIHSMLETQDGEDVFDQVDDHTSIFTLSTVSTSSTLQVCPYEVAHNEGYLSFGCSNRNCKYGQHHGKTPSKTDIELLTCDDCGVYGCPKTTGNPKLKCQMEFNKHRKTHEGSSAGGRPDISKDKRVKKLHKLLNQKTNALKKASKQVNSLLDEMGQDNQDQDDEDTNDTAKSSISALSSSSEGSETSDKARAMAKDIAKKISAAASKSITDTEAATVFMRRDSKAGAGARKGGGKGRGKGKGRSGKGKGGKGRFGKGKGKGKGKGGRFGGGGRGGGRV